MHFQRLIKIRHLRLIQVLAREASFRRAAALLGTSQSAVSRGLTEIEQLLGARLFDRTTRSMVPTEIGHSLIWHSERILRDLDQAEADCDALLRGVTQNLHVGLLRGFSPEHLGSAVMLFNKRMPSIDLRFVEGFAEDLFIELLQGRLELILCHTDVPQQNTNISITHLYQEEIAIVTGRGRLSEQRRVRSLGELADLRWVLPPTGTTIRTIMDKALLRARATRLPVVECVGPHFVATILRSSDTIAALPGSIMAWLLTTSRDLVRVRIGDPLPKWPVCVARLVSAPKNLAADQFAECLREVFGIAP